MITKCSRLIGVNPYMHGNLLHIINTHWYEMKAAKLKNLVEEVVNISSKIKSISLEHQIK